MGAPGSPGAPTPMYNRWLFRAAMTYLAAMVVCLICIVILAVAGVDVLP